MLAVKQAVLAQTGTLVLLAVTACHSTLVPASQSAFDATKAEARPPCFSGYHVIPSYTIVARGYPASFTFGYTQDLYRCPFTAIKTDWAVIGPHHPQLSCRKHCATTTFSSGRRGTYHVIAASRYEATAIVK